MSDWKRKEQVTDVLQNIIYIIKQKVLLIDRNNCQDLVNEDRSSHFHKTKLLYSYFVLRL